MKEPDVLKEINNLFSQAPNKPQAGDSVAVSIAKMEAMIAKKEKK